VAYRRIPFFQKALPGLRAETEWVELVTNGTAVLVDADPEKISNEFEKFFGSESHREYPGFMATAKQLNSS